MKLYDFDLSGNCYKVRLLCALLNVPVDLVPVDLKSGAHKRSPLIYLNAFGQIPILQDNDLILRDSHAILVYLARKWGGEAWLPMDAGLMALVTQWLMVAENEIARGQADARRHDKFGANVDVVDAREKATRVLSIMDKHLADRDWLVLDRPTIADVACMPYVALGWEGGVPFDPYPAVAAWVDRIKKLPRFISMPGV
ncbi:MAG: glutathione S-transferase [Proteobacteria bacterium]|nr:glutathione S-transferase [Pseudomonadota bacterium]